MIRSSTPPTEEGDASSEDSQQNSCEPQRTILLHVRRHFPTFPKVRLGSRIRTLSKPTSTQAAAATDTDESGSSHYDRRRNRNTSYHPSPPARLRSSMTVTSLDDSLGTLGLSRPNRRSSAATFKSDIQSSSERSVSFGTIKFRHFERIPGDNPSICWGVPLAIGWAYNEDGEPISVEEYEASRSREPKRRDELYVKPSERESILKEEWGISRSALQAAEKKVSIAIKQRRKTTEQLKLAAAEEVIESAKKTLGRIIHRKGSWKEEERLWRETQKSWQQTQTQQHQQDGGSDYIRDDASRCQSEKSESNASSSLAKSPIVSYDPYELDIGQPRSQSLIDNRPPSGRSLPKLSLDN